MLSYDMQKRNEKTKTGYLYYSIKEDILNGKILPDEKLPSKRELAEHLKISVITIENAYAMLEEEGYIRAKAKSGFYANDLKAKSSGSAKQKEILYLKEESAEMDPVVPVQGIEKRIRHLLSEHPDIMLRKPPHLGCAVLRNAIADHLRRFRGMEVQPSQIIIGSGAEYLYGLTVQLFGRDCVYGIEDPCYEKIEKVYLANGAKIERLPMDKSGISKEALARTKARLLHVTPFHSYPTGITASAKKRFEYLAWAENNNSILLEDDYDSELSFFKKPIETLYSMDRSERVIYMNTFSKSIAPGMRIAYMILPGPLLTLFQDKLGFYSCSVPVFDQYVLAEFIKDGGFERHLGRVRKQLLSQKN